MVNLGPSRGCQTCRRRKVKCDETKPICRRCANSKLDCGGYKKSSGSIRFKDQTHAVEQRWQTHATALTTQSESLPRPIPALLEDGERIAICFFLRNLATIGRELDSATGFFECVQPCLAVASHGSAVARAVVVVALRLSVAWRRTSPYNALHQKRVSEALEALRAALQDPVESKSTGTLLATILLQFHENLYAMRNVKKAERTHQDGALALIRHRGFDNFQTDVGRHLLIYVRHAQVSSAVREKRRAPDDLATWRLPDDLLLNPSAELDTVSISVASLQYDFVGSMQHQSDCLKSHCPHERNIADMLDKAQGLEKVLMAWARDVRNHWRPRRLDPVVKVQPPILLYQGACDIYPSIQIASVWNSYRHNRLLMLKILLTFTSKSLRSRQPTAPSDQNQHLVPGDLRQRVQELVDAICHSVPFYLGNRKELNPVEDLDGQGIELPGFHSLDPEALAAISKTGKVLSRADHTRHAVAHGAWHMTSILSQLSSLLSDETGYQLAPILPPGQFAWIRQQLVRAATLAGVRREKLAPQPPRKPPAPQSALVSQDHRDLAERLRESLRLSGIN